MFEVTFLGTAASTPSAERGLPAVLVQAASQRFLIDCGEGTQRQILRAGSGFRRLGHVLLTHAHLDHVLGLGGLIASLGLFDVRDTLRICGSGETLRFVQPYLASLFPLPRERGHLTAAEAGRLAAAAKVGALYLTHISGRYDPAEIAAEAGRFFAAVSVASDFDRVSVTASTRQKAD